MDSSRPSSRERRGARSSTQSPQNVQYVLDPVPRLVREAFRTVTKAPEVIDGHAYDQRRSNEDCQQHFKRHRESVEYGLERQKPSS